jgi:hypothetical protein
VGVFHPAVTSRWGPRSFNLRGCLPNFPSEAAASRSGRPRGSVLCCLSALTFAPHVATWLSPPLWRRQR